MVTDTPIFSPKNGLWTLVDDWRVHIRYRDESFKLTIPKGFETDLGSVPTALEWVIENDQYVEAFVVHDYLYVKKTFARSLADALMYQIIAEKSKKDAYLCWVAVRLFGWVAWKQC